MPICRQGSNAFLATNGLSKLQARLLPLLGQHVSVNAFSAQLSLRLLQALCLELSSLLVCQSFLLEQENMRSSIERRRIERSLGSSKFLYDSVLSPDRLPV